MIERMELGEFYKELRLARKLKQSDVACDGLTASQLSKFELGQSMLSADKLILAIQGINMNFDEFGHKLNNYQESPHMRIGRRIVDRFVHQDIAGLEQLLEEVEEEISPSPKLLSTNQHSESNQSENKVSNNEQTMLPNTGESASLLTILFGFVGVFLGAMIFYNRKDS